MASGCICVGLVYLCRVVQAMTLYAVMRACTWSSVEVNGIPLTQPKDGPQRYIPVFDTQEQAIEWAQDGDRIHPLSAMEKPHG